MFSLRVGVDSGEKFRVFSSFAHQRRFSAHRILTRFASGVTAAPTETTCSGKL